MTPEQDWARVFVPQDLAALGRIEGRGRNLCRATLMLNEFYYLVPLPRSRKLAETDMSHVASLSSRPR